MKRFNKIASIARHWSPKLGVDTLDLAMDIDAVDSLHSLRLDDMIADLDAGSVAHDVAGRLGSAAGSIERPTSIISQEDCVIYKAPRVGAFFCL